MITTWVPRPTCDGNHSAECIEMRMQPCDAGCAGTDSDPWTA